MAFFFLETRPERGPANRLNKRLDKTTKSHELQTELYHQGWTRSKPTSHQ